LSTLLQDELLGRMATAIFDCMDDGVLVVDPDGRVLFYNAAAPRLLGIGRLPNPGEPIAGATGQPELERAMSALARGSSPAPPVLCNLCVGGRNLVARVCPACDAGSAVLISSAASPSQDDRASSGFIAVLSHELRAPVAAILSYLDVLVAGLAGADQDQLRRMLVRCSERAKGLLALIDDLLGISQVTAGQVAKHLEPLALSDLVEEVADLMRALAQDRGLTLTTSAQPGLPLVMADRGDIVRLVTNLLSNAIKYNRPGGHVGVALARAGQWVRLDVADTGIGIPSAEQSKVWDEFYRVSSPDTKGVPGTGLGLSLVKRVVRAHNGRIELDSTPGVGSTFRVYLPALPAS